MKKPYPFLYSKVKCSLLLLVLYSELGYLFADCHIVNIFSILVNIAGCLTEVFNRKIRWRQLPGELPNLWLSNMLCA